MDCEKRAAISRRLRIRGIGMALVAPGRRCYESPSLCGLSATRPKNCSPPTFNPSAHPEDLDTDVGQMRQMLDRSLSHYDMEKRYLHKDGHIVWVLLSVSLVRDAAGQPLYFVSQIQDIRIASSRRVTHRK